MGAAILKSTESESQRPLIFQKDRERGSSSKTEALRAVIEVDPREAQNADNTLREQFIEGAETKSLKSQLKMLSAQHPESTFLDFKELSIRILGVELNQESTKFAVCPADSYGDAKLMCPVSPGNTLLAAQGAQVQIPDAVADLKDQVAILTKSLEKVCHKLEQLEMRPQPECESPQHRSRPTDSASKGYYRRSGRLPTDRFDTHGRPICKHCHKSGHVERECWRSKEHPSGGRTLGPEDPNWLTRYVGPHPLVTIHINGVPLTALLDTGSQVTTIQKAMFEKYWSSDLLMQPPEVWLNVIASQTVRQYPCKVTGNPPFKWERLT
ncbi:uncharacterized protein LOC142760526 [Rhinoderma darwinii]|uniref:uncharacterized protein LOC142760526 n=1 Tax=Rhinoderma darwinii TaxID=43563 RepID=UPI003F67325F